MLWVPKAQLSTARGIARLALDNEARMARARAEAASLEAAASAVAAAEAAREAEAASATRALRAESAARLAAARAEGLQCEFAVDEELMGLVIGKAGAHIKRVQETTGAQGVVLCACACVESAAGAPPPGGDCIAHSGITSVKVSDNVVRVRGPTRESVLRAREMLEYSRVVLPVPQRIVRGLMRALPGLQAESGVVKAVIGVGAEPTVTITGTVLCVAACKGLVEVFIANGTVTSPSKPGKSDAAAATLSRREPALLPTTDSAAWPSAAAPRAPAAAVAAGEAATAEGPSDAAGVRRDARGAPPARGTGAAAPSEHPALDCERHGNCCPECGALRTGVECGPCALGAYQAAAELFAAAAAASARAPVFCPPSFGGIPMGAAVFPTQGCYSYGMPLGGHLLHGEFFGAPQQFGAQQYAVPQLSLPAAPVDVRAAAAAGAVTPAAGTVAPAVAPRAPESARAATAEGVRPASHASSVEFDEQDNALPVLGGIGIDASGGFSIVQAAPESAVSSPAVAAPGAPASADRASAGTPTTPAASPAGAEAAAAASSPAAAPALPTPFAAVAAAAAARDSKGPARAGSAAAAASAASSSGGGGGGGSSGGAARGGRAGAAAGKPPTQAAATPPGVAGTPLRVYSEVFPRFGVARKLLYEGDECPICQLVMLATDQLTWCTTSCGNNVHAKCMADWAAHLARAGEPVACPTCRSGARKAGRARPSPALASSRDPNAGFVAVTGGRRSARAAEEASAAAAAARRSATPAPAPPPARAAAPAARAAAAAAVAKHEEPQSDESDDEATAVTGRDVVMALLGRRGGGRGGGGGREVSASRRSDDGVCMCVCVCVCMCVCMCVCVCVCVCVRRRGSGGQRGSVRERDRSELEGV